MAPQATQLKIIIVIRSITKNPSAIQPQCDVSRDPNISLFSESVLQRLTRSLIASVVVVLLLVPIVILNALASIALRMAVIVVASAFLIVAVSSFTNAKTVEVFVSGAT